MKKILFFCLFILCSLSIYAADEEVYCLAVSFTTSDEVDFFAFSASPIATFGEGTLSITQDGDDAYSIVDVPITDVKEWYFRDAVPGQGTDGLSSVPLGGGELSISGGQVLVTGLKAGAQVCVYTADGRMVSQVVATQDGRAVVDMNSLKSGQVYVLRTPNVAYKIVK